MEIGEIIKHFQIKNNVKEYIPLGNGHINTTFLVTTDNEDKYVLQKINSEAFKDINLLMNNFFKVTNYLRNHGFESLNVIKTKEDKLYYQTENAFYRLYTYIDDVMCYESIDNMYLVYNSARAFGKLHKALKGFDASELGEVIPNFHNTYQRYLNLLNAIELDKCERVRSCLREIEIAKSFEKEYSKIVDGISSGEISLSVTHNDPKINNVLFDKFSGEIRAVIDLDTVMPGSYLYDFGDALRSLFSGENEDSTDLSKLVVDYDIFEAYTKGYLLEMKDTLTKREIELLPFSAFLITIECGMRFLEDYLRGDIYFRTKYPEHNLIRARTQFKLAADIYNDFDNLNKIVQKLMN